MTVDGHPVTYDTYGNVYTVSNSSTTPSTWVMYNELSGNINTNLFPSSTPFYLFKLTNTTDNTSFLGTTILKSLSGTTISKYNSANLIAYAPSTGELKIIVSTSTTNIIMGSVMAALLDDVMVLVPSSYPSEMTLGIVKFYYVKPPPTSTSPISSYLQSPHNFLTSKTNNSLIYMAIDGYPVVCTKTGFVITKNNTSDAIPSAFSISNINVTQTSCTFNLMDQNYTYSLGLIPSESSILGTPTSTINNATTTEPYQNTTPLLGLVPNATILVGNPIAQISYSILSGVMSVTPTGSTSPFIVLPATQNSPLQLSANPGAFGVVSFYNIITLPGLNYFQSQINFMLNITPVTQSLIITLDDYPLMIDNSGNLMTTASTNATPYTFYSFSESFVGADLSQPIIRPSQPVIQSYYSGLTTFISYYTITIYNPNNMNMIFKLYYYPENGLLKLFDPSSGNWNPIPHARPGALVNYSLGDIPSNNFGIAKFYYA